MDLTVEQRDLRDAVRGLIEKAGPTELTGPTERNGTGRPPWRRLCDEVGVAGLAIPERYGGAGAGLAEICVVMEELGRNLTPTPMLGSSVLAAQAVLASGDDAACERLLPPVAGGSVIAALAWATSAGRWDPAEVACQARDALDGWELDGEAHYVLDGDTADLLLVAASTPDGTGLFEVDQDAAGVNRTAVTTMDASRSLALVRLTAARARRVGGDATGPLAIARDQACIALGAEQAGAAQRALELTVRHLLTRVQFGQAIGGFQALQHRAADLYVLVESARSLSRAAAAAADGAPPPRGDSPRASGDYPSPHPPLAAAAKVYCSEALTQVASEMIQLHGAIAITWEHQAHRYLKRAHGGRYLFGTPASHLATIAASLIDDIGGTPPEPT